MERELKSPVQQILKHQLQMAYQHRFVGSGLNVVAISGNSARDLKALDVVGPLDTFVQVYVRQADAGWRVYDLGAVGALHCGAARRTVDRCYLESCLLGVRGEGGKT